MESSSVIPVGCVVQAKGTVPVTVIVLVYIGTYKRKKEWICSVWLKEQNGIISRKHHNFGV